ncbi:hypothetical protein DITRI_Ditri01bG0158600 [Diplodiscus trichospermus]
MGIWDFISGSTDSVKGLWQSSYNLGSTAITMVNQQLSEPETREKISRVATNVAKNAAIEGLKIVPGAYPAYKIVSESLSDDKK